MGAGATVRAPAATRAQGEAIARFAEQLKRAPVDPLMRDVAMGPNAMDVEW
jgi:hypothetical protein